MDTDTPKPRRNWLGFLKEYAVIVIGVLTALAAQQAAEWWHWRGEVAEARTALRAEMLSNNVRLFARRTAIEDCLTRQVKEAETVLANLEAKRPPGRFTTFHSGSGSLLNDAEWQSQRASQVLTHFPHAELALMNNYYVMLPVFGAWLDKEGDAWRELSVLQSPPEGLTPSDLMHLRTSLHAANGMLSLIGLVSARQLDFSKRLGLAEAKADQEMIQKFCTLDDEKYRRFVRSRSLQAMRY